MKRSMTAAAIAALGLTLAIEARGQAPGGARPPATAPGQQQPNQPQQSPPGQQIAPGQQTPPGQQPRQQPQPGQQTAPGQQTPPGQQIQPGQPQQPNRPGQNQPGQPDKPRPNTPPVNDAPPPTDQPNQPATPPGQNPDAVPPATTPGQSPQQPGTSDPSKPRRPGAVDTGPGQPVPPAQPTNPAQPNNPAQLTTPGQPAPGTPGAPNAGTNTAGAAPQAPNAQQNAQAAQAMFSGLLSGNIQTANVQNVVNIADSMNNTQVAALVQALNSNPQARAAADALTQRLRREGKIDATQRVVGFQNGQVFIASNSVATGSPATGNPATNAAGTTNPGAAGTGPAQASTQLATALSNSLVNLNVQGASVQTVVDVNTVLTREQVNGLVQAVQANDQARQTSETLTRRFRDEGRIGPQQRVIAFQDGRVYVIGGGS